MNTPTIRDLAALLTEALDAVDADEEAQIHTWPEEFAAGELTPDLGERIRKALRAYRQAQPVVSTRTQGGRIDTQAGQIVNVSCDRCHRGGLPSRINGAVCCICGNVLAESWPE
jgi:hypothetical protein